MKLRFKIDQAECLRRGIDAPKSIVTIEVNPADMSAEDRNLIADRMCGIDVLPLTSGGIKITDQILSETPDYIGLIKAVRENDREVERQWKT
jgi:hypothetical protein